jgi:hypothetical protein
MTTKLIDDEYIRAKYPQYIGLTLIPKHWHSDDEDAVYCECVEKPELSRYFFYLFLENWAVKR